MNRQGSIDDVLEAWFLDGPSAMPDRLFDAVFDQVERVPQRRLARLQLRFTDMSPTVRWLAAGAAAIILAGVGFAAVNRFPETGPGAPTPSPAASPSESASPAAGAPLPASLRHPFLGPNKAVESFGIGDVRRFDMSDGSYYYENGVSQTLPSTATVDGAELILTLTVSVGGCSAGDVGRYPWSLSPGESFLTIEAGSDQCASRLAAMPGTWQRSVCLNPDNDCLGILEPGGYSTQYVNPALSPGVQWHADFGAVRFTVPDGWANSDDWPNNYALMRASSYVVGGVNEGIITPDAITILVNPSAAQLHAGCPEAAEPGIGRDMASLTAWLREHPGLDVIQQRGITIDGRPANVLDLAMAEGWTETCDPANPFVAAPVFVGEYHWALAKDDRMRVVLLDVTDGASAAIVVDVEDPATFDALAQEAMPIIESFDFK